MRQTKSYLIAVAATALVSGPAVAADLYVPPPEAPIVAPAAYNWSGIYIGVQAGYDWNRSAASNGSTANIDGAIAGIYGGYNWQFYNNWVVGIDASINYDWARGAVSAPAPAGNFGEVDWKAFIRGRLGFAWNQLLIYGTAGAAIAPLKNVGTNPTDTQTKLGWTVGAGAEWAFGAHHVVRLDYAYADFGTYSFTTPVPFTATMRSHTVMAGVAFKW